jgi:hypothetical protein
MRTLLFEWLTVALLMACTGHAAAADAHDSLAGTWSLDDGSSDDPVRAIDPRNGGDGLGRRIARSVNVFGIPVGSLPLPGDDEADEEPLSPGQVVGALAHVFEATYRLRIAQDEKITQIVYGNAPTITYRTPETVARNGWTSKSEWRDGKLMIEHVRTADGATISERYWIQTQADELHWTARLKRPTKKGTVDVKRVFYRAPLAENALPLAAQL